MFRYVHNDLDVAHKFDFVPQPSPEYSKHYHDFYEIYYFVRGDVLYTVDEEKKILERGDLIFIFPGKHHFVTFTNTASYERYVIKFQEHRIPEFIIKNLIKRSAFYGVNEKFDALFDKLDKLYEKYDTLELQLLLSNVVSELLVELNRSKTNSKTENDKDINAIIQFINQNIRRPLTVKDLSENFHISPSHLYRKFYNHMRIPLIKYINSKRIIAANQLIKKGEKPTKVAEFFGYNDYSTFYRQYIAIMGFSPNKSQDNKRPK